MIKMYLPNTPSFFMEPAKIYKVKKVKMTCGGGMGGCSWDEYIVDFPKNFQFGNGWLDVTNYKGEKMILNARYIVKISDSQIVGMKTNSQNPHYAGIKTNYYETPIDDSVELCEGYGNNEVNGVKWLDRTDF